MNWPILGLCIFAALWLIIAGAWLRARAMPADDEPMSDWSIQDDRWS